jgi:hypothetical protein
MEQATLRSGVLKLQEQLNSEWNEKFTELQHILDIHGEGEMADTNKEVSK